MPGRGRAPKDPTQRRTRHAPTRGEWQASPGLGWQHGTPPEPPEGLLQSSLIAWDTWMRSWFAAHWTPEDLPGLRVVIQLYDKVQDWMLNPFTEREVERGEQISLIVVPKPNPTTELRQMMDNYGITPKGQQDRRWVKAKEELKPQATASGRRSSTPSSPYSHLRVVG